MSRMRLMLSFFAVWFILGFNTVYAEDRALIIGLGTYAKSDANLPGLDPTLTVIQEIVFGRLGFQSGQVQVITNEQVTSAGIQNAISEWLIRGTTANDRAFLYYYGHGAQIKDDNGDEPDGCDESLYTYEGNFLRDDVLTRLVSSIPAKEVLFMLDSCFSGGAYRSLTQDTEEATAMTPSALSIVCGKAANLGQRPADNISPIDERSGRVLGMTAAGENEVGYTSNKGSWFSRALLGALKSTSEPISFVQMRDLMASTMREFAGQRYISPVPQLFGPPQWLTRTLSSFGRVDSIPPPVLPTPPTPPVNPVLPTPPANPAPPTPPVNPTPPTPPVNPAPPYNGDPNAASNNNDLLDRILNRSAFRVEVRSTKTTLRVGEKIVIDVRSSKSGYLNLFDLGPDGKLYLLFPNKFNQLNQVIADETISLPSSRVGNFSITAAEPTGRSRVLALITTYNVNLYDATLGALIAQFKVFGGQDAGSVGRSLITTPDSNAADVKQHGAGQALIDVVK